jgi:hypothetical protein
VGCSVLPFKRGKDGEMKIGRIGEGRRGRSRERSRSRSLSQRGTGGRIVGIFPSSVGEVTRENGECLTPSKSKDVNGNVDQVETHYRVVYLFFPCVPYSVFDYIIRGSSP